MNTAASGVLAKQLWFTAPMQVEVREQVLPALQAGELLVACECSAISAGTELLLYRGQIPQDMLLDSTLGGMQQPSLFPLQYGYASVGRVLQAGSNVDQSWLGQRVFAFQPHASHFISTPAQLIRVPDDIAPDAAAFLANMETAVNLVQDGQPGIGETVLVMGQGIVGLLLTSLLAQFPLSALHAVDMQAHRRQLALQLGATHVFDATHDINALHEGLSAASGKSGADLIYEVSGAPAALDLAVKLSGYASRIVIGSWYGNKPVAVALGGEAHRNRLQFITSQVSTLAPSLSGRWDKSRRLDIAWQMIRQLQPARLITHRASLQTAATLYQSLHEGAPDIAQAMFYYSD